MLFPDRSIAGVRLHVLGLVRRFVLFLALIPALRLLLFQLDWGFQTALTSTPVITIGTILWKRSGVRAELILGVGHMGRLGIKRNLSFRS